MTEQLVPATEFDATNLAEIFNTSFAGYTVPVQVTAGFTMAWTRRESLDLSASRVLVRNQTPVGIALIARRGWTGRLAAMALVPDARGQGRGRYFLDALLEDAAVRGERRIVLECIEQNAAGCALYRGAGFTTIRRLVGYTRPATENGEATEAIRVPDLEEVDPAVVASVLAAVVPPEYELPWQISPPTLVHATPPVERGFRLGSAFALLAVPPARRDSSGVNLVPESLPSLHLKAIVTLPDARRQGAAFRLLQSIDRTFPGRAWNIAALFPEDATPSLWERFGFQRELLTQLQMVRSLTPRTTDRL